MMHSKPPATSAVVALACAVAVLCGGIGTGHAASSPAPSLPAETVTIGFEDLFGNAQPAPLLEGERDALELSFHLPATAAPGPSTLRVALTSSVDVMPERSFVTIEANGTPLVRLPAWAASQPLVVDIGLPSGILKPGRNLLTFKAEQIHRVRCSLSATYQLWTRVDSARSSLTLPINRTDPGNATLDEMLFDPRSAGDPFEILLPQAVIDEAVLTEGALLAQTLALRLDGRAQSILARRFQPETAGEGLLPGLPASAVTGRRALLMGTAAELAGVLAPRIVERITGPAVYVLPDRQRRPVAVVTGRRPDEVAAAALSLAEATARAVPPVLAPHGLYTLSSLGYVETEATTLHHAAEVRLPLPADALPGIQAPVALSLSLAYAGGLAKGAALDVFLNGQWATRLPLDRTDGTVRDGVRLNLPGRLLRPGDNRLRFEARLGADDVAGCAPAGGGPLFVLFGDSTVRLPNYIRLGQAPDLRLLADSAFPLADPSDHAPTAFLVTSADDDTVSAAWTLAARLGQAARRPLTEAAWRLSVPPGDVDAVVVGPFASIPKSLTAGLSLPLPLGPRLPLPISAASAPFQPAAVNGADPTEALLKSLAERRAAASNLRPQPKPSAGAAPEPVASSLRDAWVERLASATSPGAPPPAQTMLDRLRRHTGEMGDGLTSALWGTQHDADAAHQALQARLRGGSAALFTGHIPHGRRGVTYLVTAPSPELLRQRVEALVQPARWDRLAGDTTVWDEGTEQDMTGLTTGRLAEPVYIGALPLDPRGAAIVTGRWAGERPLRLFGLTLGIILVFSVATWAILRGRQKRLFHDA